MRIFINGRFLSQTITGVQRAALETVLALDRLGASGDSVVSGLEMEVLAPRGARLRDRLTHIPVRSIGALSGHTWEQVELPWHSRTGVLVSLANAAPLVRSRQCVTVHDASVFAVPEAYSPVYRAWYRTLIPGLGRRAGRIITDSVFSRAELVRHAGIIEDKIRVVPLGAEHILAAPCDISVLANAGLERRRFILAVSSNGAHKNLDALGEAARHFEDRPYQVVIAGGNNPRVFEAEATSWPGRVKHLGYVTDAQLRALYTHAGCFVYPSLYEGFGLPPLEAMSCGCPVVVSNAASLPEVCGNAAVYCDPLDPVDIARSIVRVMQDDALREDLRYRGYERARKFTWERSARLLIDVLQETWTE
jgi:glycosyltransferase involved in cell wall biosynthesis